MRRHTRRTPDSARNAEGSRYADQDRNVRNGNAQNRNTQNRDTQNRNARSGSTRNAGNPRNARNRAAQGRGTNRAPVLTPDQAYERDLDAALDNAAASRPGPEPSFAELGLPAPLVQGLEHAGIHAPFAIQTRTLPDSLAGKDVLGRAQTGSGKTLAFGIPLLARLGAGGRSGTTLPRGLVLVPTRELARQVCDVLTPLGARMGVRVTSVYGGAPMPRQISALRRGVDIVVATPGRLLDLIGQGECDLGAIEIAVLDEADHMADLGFLPDVTRILDTTPAGGQRLLFSATLDRGVAGLVRRYLVDPAVHAVAPAASPVESVRHLAFVVGREDKVAVTAEIAGRPGRTLIFVRTKHGADRLAKQLGRVGVEAAAIHGDRKQSARIRALDDFSAGSRRVLVATDVAARGIHVDDVDLVVHFDPTEDPKDYLHRSGRTARAGATGTVVSLVLEDQRRKLAELHRSARVDASLLEVAPGHDAVRELATSGEPIVVRPPNRSTPDRSDGSDDGARRRPGGSGRSRTPGRPRRSGHDRADGRSAHRTENRSGSRRRPQRRRGTTTS